MTAAKRIEAHTDIAMIGLWDAALDDAPLTQRVSPAALDEAAARGELWFAYTGGDGAFDCEIYVDDEPPPDALDSRIIVDDWRFVRAASGRLCLSGVEDYRAQKQQITGADAYFDVPAGDYRVLARSLDCKAPERHLAAAIGDDDYAYYKPRHDAEMRSLALLLLTLIAAGVVAIWLDWRIGLPLAAAGLIAFALLGRSRRHDPRFQRIDDRASEILDEFEQRALVVLELRRLAPAEPPPPGGSVTLRFER